MKDNIKINVYVKYTCKIYIVVVKHVHVNNYYKLGLPLGQEALIPLSLELKATIPPLDNNVECSI